MHERTFLCNARTHADNAMYIVRYDNHMITIEQIVNTTCVCFMIVFMKPQIDTFPIASVKDLIIVWPVGVILLRINMQLHVTHF